MTTTLDQSPTRGRGRAWLWLIFSVASLGLVGYLAYSARTACPPVRGGRLADLEMVHGLAVAPDGRTLFLATYDGLFRGERLGQAWAPVPGLCRTDVTAVAAPAAAPQRAYLSGHSIGVMASSDGGNSFRPAGAGLPAPDVHGLTADAQDPDRVYAWVVGSGLWASADAGLHWERVAEGALGLQEVYHLQAHPQRSGILYAAGAGGLSVSRDGGRTWTRLPGWQGDAYGVAVRAGAPERLLVAAGARGVLYSDDGGATWHPGANVAGEVTAVAVHPQNPQRLLAASATGMLYESRDGGDVWSLR